MSGNPKELIAARVADELKDGDLVNLGIGLPTIVANYIPKNVSITLQSENGLIGMGKSPQPGEEDDNLFNAGGQPVTVETGGAFFDSSISLGIIRGGHVDLTVLGALEVDQFGNLASWSIPGKFSPGIGGSMDLIVGAKKVIVATLHTNKKGQSKILNACELPLTAKGKVDLIVTELAVFAVEKKGLVLKELQPGVLLEEVQKKTEAPFIVSDDLHSEVFV